MIRIKIEDIDRAIQGTNIEILSYTTINKINILELNSYNSYGVYIINLKVNRSYIGMSCRGNGGIHSRLLRHFYEHWDYKSIESIDIFNTEENSAQLLEKILITIFKPEENIKIYKNFCADNYNRNIHKNKHKKSIEEEIEKVKKFNSIRLKIKEFDNEQEKLEKELNFIRCEYEKENYPIGTHIPIPIRKRIRLLDYLNELHQ